MEKELLNTEEAAKKLGVKPHTLAEWRRLKKSPPYIRIGALVRYKPSDLEEWLEKNTVKS